MIFNAATDPAEATEIARATTYLPNWTLPKTRVPCVSYSPFRAPGQRPQDPSLRISPEQIRADLQQLQAITGCVRTYGLDHGLDVLPAIAESLGLRVVLGIWIDQDPVRSRSQLERGLALAAAHPNAVRLLMVGNEVILRGEQTAEQMAGWLAEAQARTAVPVSYADVWEFWRLHASVLAPHVDIASIHVLPYWEDEPVGVDQAVAHVFEKATLLRDVLQPTPIWVAETGWPAAGRQRGPALPSVRGQQQFVQAMLAANAARPEFTINIIEAYDQPWKAAQEGAVGAAWGIFDRQGRLRALAEPSSNPRPWAFLWESHARLSGLQVAGLCLALVLAVVGRKALGLWLLVVAIDLFFLLTEGRYRSIAWGIPMLGLAAIALRGIHAPRWGSVALLGTAGLGLALLHDEGLANLQLNLYLGTAVGAAVWLLLGPAKLRRRTPVRS